MLDIIIPILNEESILAQEAKYYQTLKTKARVIFVDGGSIDRTVDIAQQYGIVIHSPAGRAAQKNCGARKAQAEHLLFLHVDTFISDGAIEAINHAIKDGAIGGCLTMRIQDQKFIFRVYETAVNFRSKQFGIIDGDLGMFVRRDIFEQLGGFDQISVMEDLVFAKKLYDVGLIHILPERVTVSSRKWHEHGFFRTFLDYSLAHVHLWTGKLKTSYSNKGCREFQRQKR